MKGFTSYRYKDSEFMKVNKHTIIKILGCQDILFDNDLSIYDRKAGIDAIADYGKKIKTISLRCRFGKDWENVNLRNHLSNEYSEIKKMQNAFTSNYTYANVIMQFNGIKDNKAESVAILNTKRLYNWISYQIKENGLDDFDVNYYTNGTDSNGFEYSMYSLPYQNLIEGKNYDWYLCQPTIYKLHYNDDFTILNYECLYK